MTTLKRNLATAWLAAAALVAPAAAQTPMDHSKMMGPAKADARGAMDMADGEVRRVDKAAGKVTLRHGEIKQLDMPPMTMVFEVKDKAMLDTLKPGDKVKFRAVDDSGKLTVTEIRPAP
jgi:Cu/Ag efflux protein CusF